MSVYRIVYKQVVMYESVSNSYRSVILMHLNVLQSGMIRKTYISYAHNQVNRILQTIIQHTISIHFIWNISHIAKNSQQNIFMKDTKYR